MSKVLIGRGHVHHSRQEGAKNGFHYPTFFLQFNCADESIALQSLKARFHRVMSVQVTDYLNGKSGTFGENITSFLNESCSYEAEEVWLHSLPRMFGYAFNPVSFWLCRKQGKLDAVLVEVNNTFGEKHFYWLNPEGGIRPEHWLKAEKAFHVSPFFPVEGYYQFRFQTETSDSRIDINYHGPDGKLRLATWVTGNLNSIQENSLISILLNYGWMTPMVVLRIHLQAIRLWLKKSHFYSKPAMPGKKVTS